MPAMNTTGNSRPLALCRVISVISAEVSTIGVDVGVQADLLQEAVEAGLVGALVVLGGDADELLEVLEAALGLERLLRLQGRLVAALVEHAAHDLGHRAAGEPGLQALDETSRRPAGR